MNVQLDPRIETQADLLIADCDIHPNPKSVKAEVYPFLEKRWQDHMDRFGYLMRQGGSTAYPKGQPDAMRSDAWPEDGGRAGSDLDLMRRQHLDPNKVGFGVLSMLRAGHALTNLDFAAAYARAINDWMVEYWTSREPRLKGSIAIPFQDTEASVREIERRAGDPNFVQVLLLGRTAEPIGNRRYWPIYEAAAAAGLPIGVHAFGAGGYPITGGGWPSYYIEDMTAHAQACQAGLTSMVIEGVFERIPALKLVMIEAGFAWLPSLAWRLDRLWRRLREEVPYVKRLPSEYIREQVWLTSQPMEEPEPREQVLDAIEWIGWDRLLFATDYPHWDFDDPATCLPLRIGAEQRRMFFRDNALKLYRPR